MTSTIGEPREVRARASTLALVQKIGEVVGERRVPDSVWAAVEEPSRAYMTTIARWEQSGATEDFAAARERAGDVVRAWRKAMA